METHYYHIENEADRLLSKTSKCSAAYFGRCSLARKLRVDRERGHRLDVRLDTLSEATTMLRRNVLRAVVLKARLTQRQSQVLRASLAGQGWLDIGRRLGMTKQAARRVFLQAIKKIRHAWDAYPFAGLDQVYREEVRRFAPRRR